MSYYPLPLENSYTYSIPSDLETAVIPIAG